MDPTHGGGNNENGVINEYKKIGGGIKKNPILYSEVHLLVQPPSLFFISGFATVVSVKGLL